MDTKVEHLAQEILGLSEGERQELAEEVLPLLLMTRAGVGGIDQALRSLSDQELDAIVERLRARNRDIPEETIAMVIGDALRAARSAGRS